MPGTVLSSAWLSEANFDGANLCAAKLDWSDLQKALLCNANLRDASLESANLTNADCSDSDFTDAVLAGAKLESATCIATRFTRADLSNVNLKYSTLTAAKFSHAQLDFARLEYSQGFEPELHRDVVYRETRMSACMTKTTKKPFSLKTWTEENELLGYVIVGILTALVSGGVFHYYPNILPQAEPEQTTAQPSKAKLPVLKQSAHKRNKVLK